jgi:hypothetical protein
MPLKNSYLLFLLLILILVLLIHIQPQVTENHISVLYAQQFPVKININKELQSFPKHFTNVLYI